MVDPHADPIELVSSRFDEWRAAFQAERDRVRRALGSADLDGHVHRIEHVGSTAVPGLPAKDIVDLDIVVADAAVPEIASVIAAELGGDRYEGSTEWHPVFREHDDQRFNDHVFAASGSGWKTSVVTRDVLRTHEDHRAAYEALKRDLAADHDGLDAYSEAKSPFMDELLKVGQSDPQLSYDFEIPIP